MAKERIEWVDVIKGFAIIMVMWGHTYNNALIHVFIYSFHIPLFFLMSGYFFSIKNMKYKDFLWYKIKTLLFPMAIFSIINVFIQIIINFDNLAIIPKRLAGIFIELRGSQYDSGLWFITCLFVAELIYWIVIKLSKDNLTIEISLLLICAIVGNLYIAFVDHIVPWSIEAALIAIGFLGAGRLIRTYESKFIDQINAKVLVVCIIIFAVSSFLNYMYGVCPDIYADKIGIIPLYYISALSGSMIFIIVFRLLPTSRVLKFVGQNSFIFYAFHGTMFSLISKAFVADTVISGIIYVIIGMCLCSIIAWLINKYTPWMLGRIVKNEV